jgi:MFS transporter, PPP family, 3-phenylpropionic acid transporter
LYWRLSSFYFSYFAFVGAFSAYWSLYLQSLAISALQIGALMSVLQAMRIFAPGVWGAIADRLAVPVKVIRFAASASVIAFAGVFFGDRFAWLLLVMCVMSFFSSGPLPLVEAATMNHLGDNTANYGRIRLWGSIGFVLAVVSLGALLDHVAVRWLPWILLALAAAIAACAFLLPVARIAARHVEQGSVVQILRRRDVVTLFSACFLMIVAHGPMYVFYTIYLVDHHYSKLAVGLLTSLGVVCEIFVFLYLPQLFSRYSLRGVLLFSFALAAIRFLLIGWAVDSVVLMTLAQLMHAATFGAYHCAALTMVHRLFRGQHQAKGQALYTSLSFGAGGALGGLLSGAAWERLGPGVTFSIASLIAMAGFFLLLRHLEFDPT